jgi:uncharacterized membrane protein YvbJ
MKACAHCGGSMADAAIHCSSCGFRQGSGTRESIRQVDEAVGKPVGLLAVLIFSVLLLTAAAVYMFN